jgi:hypothetical protein
MIGGTSAVPARAGRPKLPARAADPDGLGGRGLMIIDSLAKDWGADRKADGKVVWVMLSPPDPTFIGGPGFAWS